MGEISRGGNVLVQDQKPNIAQPSPRSLSAPQDLVEVLIANLSNQTTRGSLVLRCAPNIKVM